MQQIAQLSNKQHLILFCIPACFSAWVESISAKSITVAAKTKGLGIFTESKCFMCAARSRRWCQYIKSHTNCSGLHISQHWFTRNWNRRFHAQSEKHWKEMLHMAMGLLSIDTRKKKAGADFWPWKVAAADVNGLIAQASIWLSSSGHPRSCRLQMFLEDIKKVKCLCETIFLLDTPAENQNQVKSHVFFSVGLLKSNVSHPWTLPWSHLVVRHNAGNLETKCFCFI